MINVHITGLPQCLNSNGLLNAEDLFLVLLQAVLKTISIKISINNVEKEKHDSLLL